jgi:hypothetical protein
MAHPSRSWDLVPHCPSHHHAEPSDVRGAGIGAHSDASGKQSPLDRIIAEDVFGSGTRFGHFSLSHGMQGQRPLNPHFGKGDMNHRQCNLKSGTRRLKLRDSSEKCLWRPTNITKFLLLASTRTEHLTHDILFARTSRNIRYSDRHYIPMRTKCLRQSSLLWFPTFFPIFLPQLFNDVVGRLLLLLRTIIHFIHAIAWAGNDEHFSQSFSIAMALLY